MRLKLRREMTLDEKIEENIVASLLKRPCWAFGSATCFAWVLSIPWQMLDEERTERK